MELTFSCPKTNTTFHSRHYALLADHVIAEMPKGRRELRGTVALTTACPQCGEMHHFPVEDVLCPIGGGDK